MARNYSRPASFLICVFVYVVAVAVVYSFVKAYQDAMNGLWLALAADILATVVVFAFSLALKNASLYDPYWSVAPPLMASYWLYTGNENVASHFMWIAIIVWAIRLTVNWGRGWRGLSHEDWRYRMLREKNPKLYPVTNFAGIHLFPTGMIFLGMLPVYFTTISTDTVLISEGFSLSRVIFFIGFLNSLSAVLLELIADEQMLSFKKSAKPGEFINEGVWRYSRHPNYYAEISFWLGLWIMQMSVAPEYWWTCIGFIAMLLMFIFASIPMMEEKLLKTKKGYEDYKQKVSMLLLLPPKK